QNNGKKYVTVVVGAKDMYDRDRLIQASLDSMEKKKNDTPIVADKTEKTPYKINMIGDTYFGEFYTRIRKRQGRLDGLQKYGRAYSFDRIRPLIEDGEYNRRHVAPYSLFVQLIYEDNRFELRLYPI